MTVVKEIKIEFDYLHGPLWKDMFDVNTGEWSTGIPCIDNDKAVQALNDEAEMMYESLYSFDSCKGGCRFDEERFEQIKGQLLSIVQTLINRLSAINDGSYIIKDNASKILQPLEQTVEEKRKTLNRLESSCIPSTRSLDSFREERLSKYEG